MRAPQDPAVRTTALLRKSKFFVTPKLYTLLTAVASEMLNTLSLKTARGALSLSRPSAVHDHVVSSKGQSRSGETLRLFILDSALDDN